MSSFCQLFDVNSGTIFVRTSPTIFLPSVGPCLTHFSGGLLRMRSCYCHGLLRLSASLSRLPSNRAGTCSSFNFGVCTHSLLGFFLFRFASCVSTYLCPRTTPVVFSCLAGCPVITLLCCFDFSSATCTVSSRGRSLPHSVIPWSPWTRVI